MNKLFFLLALFFYSNVKAQYFPPKRDNISREEFDLYTNILTKIYLKQQTKTINFNIAVCYSHLGESNDSVFYHLELSFRDFPNYTCRYAVDNPVLIQPKTGKNLFEEVDSIKYRALCEKCKVLSSTWKKVEDTIRDTQLAAVLKIMMDDDQKLRLQMRDFSDDKQKTAELWKKQKEIDSLNLIKVDSLIIIGGYPGKSKVGTTLGNVAFFVIQHSPYTETKEKYLPILIKATYEAEISPVLLRLLLDRIYVEHFDKQIFGTQQIANSLTGKMETPAIDLRENIQKWLTQWDALKLYPEFSK